MRVIKFRAWVATKWDKQGEPCNHKMVQWTLNFFSDMSIVTGYSDEFPTEPDCYLMQFTGLTDKNGKEIYEGDIVDCSKSWWDAAGPAGHDSPIIVVGWKENTTGFLPFALYDTDCDVYIWAHDVEVIGNIHENPDLLERGI